jgi:membrane protein DedA with SNARE-associated domain
MTIIDNLIAWYSAHMNYASITALMAVESSFIPFPSEVVIPPAAFVANQPESVLYATDVYWVNVLIIVFFGTLGAIIGALINYYLSRWLGRPIIYKFADSKLGHLCLLSGVKIERAEVYFREHGNMSTFIGRFIPGIRQLISIPAGLAKMKLLPFLLYTFLGAFIWNCVLALLGYFAAGNIDTIKKYSHELSVAILVIVGAAIVYFVVESIVNSRKKKQ